jgi:type IV pilus assembly protein PilX
MNRVNLRAARKGQRGVILFIALIVLVAMSLAGIALMRSVDTNVLVAGNLAYRQSATGASDWGIESARQYLKNTLTGNPAALDLDVPSGGYYASWQSGIDLYGRTSTTTDDFNWSGAGLLVGTDTAGNEVRYVIQRLCGNSGSGTSAAANCIKTAKEGAGGAIEGGTMGTVSYGVTQLPPPLTIYYRVTVRVAGPRNTQSFVQAVLK